MTVRELIQQLERHNPDLQVRYNYDSGHSFPTLVSVQLRARPDYSSQDLPDTFVCLDEDEPE